MSHIVGDLGRRVATYASRSQSTMPGPAWLRSVTTEMPLSQEAEMMECFSRLVADGSPPQAAREQWAGYITGTQRVANAVLESLRSGGAPVTL